MSTIIFCCAENYWPAGWYEGRPQPVCGVSTQDVCNVAAWYMRRCELSHIVVCGGPCEYGSGADIMKSHLTDEHRCPYWVAPERVVAQVACGNSAWAQAKTLARVIAHNQCGQVERVMVVAKTWKAGAVARLVHWQTGLPTVTLRVPEDLWVRELYRSKGYSVTERKRGILEISVGEIDD